MIYQYYKRGLLMKFYHRHILIGQYDWTGNYHYDCILNLTENVRPHWFFDDEEEDGRVKVSQYKSHMIPSLENIYEDALILIAYEVEKDENFMSFMNKLLNRKTLGLLDIYEDITDDQRKHIKTKLKQVEFKHDLVFINIPINQAKLMKKYKIKGKYLVDVDISMKS